jgi:hypothetical protein
MLEQSAGSDSDAEALLSLWGLKEPEPRLERYSLPEDNAGDARARLLEFATAALSNRKLMDGIRKRIRAICSIHARGNGTVRAMIDGAANALDLDVTAISHHPDRYLHIAAVKDRLRVQFPVVEGEKTVSRDFEPATEGLLIEENPQVMATTGPVARMHAERFNVTRRGFERSILRVHVTGLEQRTFGPMLVNRDEGHGVGFSHSVPDGEVLQFTEEGRVLLGSSDVTSLAFGWKGACFGEAGGGHRHDFVFAGEGVAGDRVASFAQATPPGALDSGFAFPHSGVSLPMPGISLGETRFASFFQEAHFSRPAPGPVEPVVQRVAPRPAVGFLDGSVFAPGPSETRRPAAQITLEWQERRAFWVNVWIPRRFRKLTPDDEEGTVTRDRIAVALNRFRPSGVRVGVEFLDDRWVLGRGVIQSADSEDVAPAGPGAGTALWDVPPEE